MPRITLLVPRGTSVRTMGRSILSSSNSASGVGGAIGDRGAICLLGVVGDVGAGRAREEWCSWLPRLETCSLVSFERRGHPRPWK
eukprot:7052715-Pyramimonas_sp.AAC.1